MAVFMVSLMGIPPLLGFYAKYYVIVAAMEADMLWLALAIVIMSGLSAYYYLRVVFVMYFGTCRGSDRGRDDSAAQRRDHHMVIANLALGLFSSGIVDLGNEWTSALTIASSVTGSQ